MAEDESKLESVAKLPGYLTERFRSWRATRFVSDRAWYAQLMDYGQRPRAMVIACCDSRVDVHGVLGAQPGELFMVRNVANLVPPYAPDHEHHGTSAAIEFAVRHLKVAHILVLGHAHCGGVKSYLDRREGRAAEDENSRFIDRWMDLLEPGYERLPPALEEAKGAAEEAGAAEAEEEARLDRMRALEQEGVLCSLRNLLSFPFVAEAVEAERLTLHGAWLDIGKGDLHAYDPESGAFAPLGG